MSITAVLLLIGAAVAVSVSVVAGQTSAPVSEEWVYLSGSPKGAANTIALYRLNLATGTLTAAGVNAELPDPNFLAVSADNRFLYASCNPKEGAVAAFAIEGGTGKLTALNQVASGGHRAVHVTLEPSGRAALVANYQGNTVAVLGINADGSLKAPTAEGIQTHTGSGPNASRQPHPFPHSIYPNSTGKFAYSCDLGADRIYCYTVDAGRATLLPNDPPTVATPPGSGPRHLAFSPDQKSVYLITEMGNTLIGYHLDRGSGALTEFQTLTTLPAGTANPEQQTAGEVEVHPNGKFLYASNRGPHSSISIFAVDAATGKLTPAGDVLSGGKHPRFFIIDPSGEFLLVGNQLSDNIAVFRIDASTGQLNPTGSIPFGAPMCMKFWMKPQ
jgi:6-phosphogluconolactonase